VTNSYSFKTHKNDTPFKIKSNYKDIYIVDTTESEIEEKLTNIINLNREDNIKIFSTHDSSIGNEVNPLINQSKNESNVNNNYLSIQEKSKKQASRFLGMLRNDIVEPGYYSSSELYLKSQLKENHLETKDWLNRVLINNLKKPDILVKLLHMISDIDYNLIEPLGPTFALAAARHPDAEVKEYSIRVFEKWANKDSLDILKGVRFQEEWLQEYADEVIAELEEELS
jgi:hypothetical protein